MNWFKAFIWVVVVVGLVKSASAATISVNFPGERTPTGLMGAPDYAAENWLNTANQACSWGITYNLEEATGNPTGAIMTVWASQFGSMQTFVTDQFTTDSQMMECGIGGWLSDAASFTVTNIPYDQYVVVIYFSSANDFDYVQKINVNSQPAIYAKYIRHVLNGYVQATAAEDLDAATAAGNFAVFQGLTDATLNVSVDAGWYSTIHPRAYICGFQIVETTDPCAGGLNKPGDLDGNCVVDFTDLIILVNNWLASGD